MGKAGKIAEHSGSRGRTESTVSEYVAAEQTGVGTSMEMTRRLRVAPKSVDPFRVKPKVTLRRGRGCSLATTVKDLGAIVRCRIGYFRLAEAKGVVEELDVWIRRRLRCVAWRQRKHRPTRAKRMMSGASRRSEHGRRPTTAEARGGTPGPAI